ncbi:hypothetical protein ABZ299_32720 [Streptomyces sp. NPDC006184]|uniref:hypothetical protein n=1 Tax=Streptomyces sp. NPDC006184 TaxID=3155455 RepID=UPI0033A6694E
MTHFLARLVEPLFRLLLPPRGRRRRGPATPPPCGYAYPYSCRYVGGPTAYRRGEAPLRGEDSPLVRPYLDRVETCA